MIGLALGAVASGALVQFGPWPRQLGYLVAAGLLVPSLVLILISPETAPRTPGAVRSLRPGVRVPPPVRSLVPVVAVLLATGAFPQAFVPALVEEQLRTDSSLVLGLVFAAYMASQRSAHLSAAGSPPRQPDASV